MRSALIDAESEPSQLQTIYSGNSKGYAGVLQNLHGIVWLVGRLRWLSCRDHPPWYTCRNHR